VENIVNRDLYGAISPFRFVLDGDEFTLNPFRFIQEGNCIGTSRLVLMGTNIEEMNNIDVFIPPGLEITKGLFQV